MNQLDAARSAGFALAHAAWSVSDTSAGELLCPLAFVDEPAGRQLFRYEADTQEAATLAAAEHLDAIAAAGAPWALVREMTFRPTTTGTAIDALMVEFGAADGSPSLKLAQQFARSDGVRPFQIIGPLLNGGTPLSVELERAILAEVRAGIADHGVAGPLWDDWLAS